MRFFSRCLLVFLSLTLLSVFITTLVLGRDGLIDVLIIHLHQQKNASKIYALVTVSRFHLLQFLAFIVILLLGAVLFYFKRFYVVVAFYIKSLSVALTASVRLCLGYEAKYILILPLFVSVWFAVQLPISYDEAYTYLNFTSKGPIASAFYYPAPNNHILHSLITNVTTFIPFFSKCFCLRISSIIVNLFTWCIAYKFLTVHFTKKVALVVVAVVSLLYMTIYYSYMSRGYALVSLFFVSSLYAAFNIIKRDNDEKNWVAFAVASILGFYAMPSFLYAFLTVNAFIFLSKANVLKKQVLVNIIILSLVTCLYVPVIIVNGIGALVNNYYVTPLPRIQVLQKLPSYSSTAITDIVGIPWPFVVIALLIAIIGLTVKKEKQLLLMCMVFLTAPFVWLLLHGVIPFSRTFVYYNFILIFILVSPLRGWLDRQKPVYLFVALFLIQGLLLWNFNSKIYKEEDYSIVAHTVCKQIVGNKKYVCDDGLFDAHLRFAQETQGFGKMEMRYINKKEMSADTIHNMDYIIIQKFVDKTIQKQPVIETPYYRIYN